MLPSSSALQQARVAAYEPGEFVEQESFMRAGEIRALARQAGIAPGVSVLDLCCGIGGPGRFITKELGCDYLGVDYSADAIDIARRRAGDLPCRFEVARIPPIPPGPFDVVILLETLLAFPEKEPLLQEISARSPPAAASPAPSKRASPSPRRSESRCPTPTPSGSSRSTRCSPPWPESAWSSLAGGPHRVPRRHRRIAHRSLRRRRRRHRRGDRRPGAGGAARAPTDYGATGCAPAACARSPWSPRGLSAARP